MPYDLLVIYILAERTTVYYAIDEASNNGAPRICEKYFLRDGALLTYTPLYICYKRSQGNFTAQDKTKTKNNKIAL